MGIPNLNRFLRENCSESIRFLNLSELNGKSIAVDISIYLYKYETDDKLLENMYIMFSVFHYYGIIPIFIFDGKPPQEKKELLMKRREDREEAKKEYEKLKQQLTKTNTNNNSDEKQEIITSMELLKKQIVQVSKEKIEKVKSLIRAYGLTYFDAPGEADELCAMLVMKKKVWACLTDDMDLFVYGCPRVLRYLSLLNHQVVLYYTTGILENLNMTHNEFKQICILSGTDYNINTDINTDTDNRLELTIKYFKAYKEDNNLKSYLDFYDWLNKNTNYINDIGLLQKINNIFNIDFNKQKLDIFKNIKIFNSSPKQNEIELILSEADFIFCKTQ
jgi:5'-3' exonuclease